MSRLDRVLVCAVVAVALVFGWSGLTSGYEGPYDEGNTLCAATRVLAGEIPYRDFWTLHPPGTTWILADAFRVFGATLEVERAVKLGVVALAAVLLFLLARLVARPLAAAAAALLFIALPTQTLSLRSRDTGLVLVLAALLAACAPWNRPRRGAFVAGLLAGLTAWFKQDFVLAAAAGGAVAVVLGAAAGPPRTARSDGPGGGTRALFFEGLFPFALGLIAGPALLAATLAAHGTLEDFFRQAILFPATTFGRFRSLPVSLRFEQLASAFGPGISSRGALDAGAVPVLFLAALVAALAAATYGVKALRRDRRGAAASSSSPVLLASSAACLLLLAAPFQRADLEHLNPALALSLVALAGVASPREPAPVPRPPQILGISLGLLVLLFGVPSVFERARLLKTRLLAPASAGVTGLPAAPRWIGLPPDVLETARFVAAVSRPAESMFVGNARHDRIVYDAPLVTFLAGRRNATRYDNLHPGSATTRPVQEEIVRSLEAAGVSWIVLWDGPPADEPNESSRSSGVRVLDAWIARHAREAARYGSFRVLEVTPPTTPPPPAR